MTDCNKLRVIFAGTPAFSVPALQALRSSTHDVVGVYCQPDRGSGRGRKIVAGAVKTVATEMGVPIFQPRSLRGTAEVASLAALRPDIMIVVAYGLLLPESVLAVPTLGCVNIHGSLLPRWRGAAPIQRAILAGDEHTGVTIMQMDSGLDTGPMLAKETYPITETTTAAQLHDDLSQTGARLLLKTLGPLCRGVLNITLQNDADATYASKLDKAEAEIDWTASADEIHRQIRAYNPTPIAFTNFDGQKLRIWSADFSRQRVADVPGTVVQCDKAALEIATGNGSLLIRTLQMPGKKTVSYRDFVNGRSLTGCVLGRAD